MTVELLVVRDCAHAEAAGIVLAHALAAEGLAPDFEVVLVDTAEQAQARRFVGSPSFVVDGRDLFESPDAVPGVACRVYGTARGLSGLPDESELRLALRAALED
ncbi:hypothetical protein [Oryzihumus leptocrescens]|uniref:hypothetical protein n=1 Tax=Oryzihumus leptocrescens TaxID=297536 RepID=UPI00114D593F|nr:hypothetical protein [Oryzihumus leptocrescens]